MICVRFRPAGAVAGPYNRRIKTFWEKVMFVKRLISGIACLLFIIFFGWLGGIPLLGFCGVISIIGLFEMYRAMGIQKKSPAVLSFICAVLVYCGLLLKYINVIRLDSNTIVLAGVVFTFILCMFTYVFSYPKLSSGDIFGAVCGFIYVPVMISYIFLTREINENGLFLVWLIFLSSWGSDTCAYCVGVLFGKHKLTPKLSPKKSVEGFVGGIAGAMILTYIIYGILLRAKLSLEIPALISVVVAVGVGACISVVGDLAASAIKRERNIKDYGKLIPGHGGIMDRFDSVIFTAPVVYFTLILTGVAG